MKFREFTTISFNKVFINLFLITSVCKGDGYAKCESVIQVGPEVYYCIDGYDVVVSDIRKATELT